MHRFNIGDKFSVVLDRWVSVGPGHDKNIGAVIEPGIVAEIDFVEPATWRESGLHVVTLEDGRRYERYDCYCASSPYGWNEAKAVPSSRPSSC